MVIPANTVLGVNKMRVVLLRQGQGISMAPCLPIGAFGEVEDYIVNIVSPPTAPISIDDNDKRIGQLNEENLSRSKSHLEAEATIYPNPSQGDFTIYNKNGIERYTIYNLKGEKIKEGRSQSKETSIKISLQETLGLYFVQIIDLNGNISKQKIYIHD
ncbi:MAG: hypothetical protein RLZZ546_284 [Bacteroidota bacterium]|jgi:hypothetical protein